ncbi:MAG: preprotein translocase subunit SecG [Gloeobacteraceae cyanobacterium ES-bin-316]|nr:preprotein translocase subunit SecG [Ferruginibacter sp.]
MLVLFGVLIILFSVVLGLIVLIQNPKGGGLSGSLSGFGNQLMGVKQSTDILEKGTWFFAAIVGFLCLASPAFIPKGASSSSENDELLNNAPTTAPKTAVPNNTVPLPGAQPVTPAKQ